MRFSCQAVRESFGHLRQYSVEGKTGVERTSGLFYFLAFDSTFQNQNPISLDPETVVGRQNREAFTREYCRLTTLKVLGPHKVLCTEDLGLVTLNGTAPEKRVSSNFLTVPLKKASQRSSPLDYPKRPLPLLRLGPTLAVGNWGIGVHPDWRVNLNKFLSERITRAPFTDLAVFVLRDDTFGMGASFEDVLTVGLSIRFSNELATYWAQQIARESRLHLSQRPEGWFSEGYHHAFDDEAWTRSVQRGSAGDQSRLDLLEHRIAYLEQLLRSHNIPFDGRRFS